MCDQLARNLSRRFGAAVIHGDKSQSERDCVLSQFRSGKSPILVATDVAARGLDIKDIRAVINYDFPTGVEDYVHRIGRTGRAGAKGVAYTFFCDQDSKYAADLVKILEGACQHVPSELQDMVSRGGYGGKSRRWGSSSGAYDGGYPRGGWHETSSHGETGDDQGYSYHKSFHYSFQGGHQDAHNDNDSISNKVGIFNQIAGGGVPCRSRSRSVSPSCNERREEWSSSCGQSNSRTQNDGQSQRSHSDHDADHADQHEVQPAHQQPQLLKSFLPTNYAIDDLDDSTNWHNNSLQHQRAPYSSESMEDVQLDCPPRSSQESSRQSERPRASSPVTKVEEEVGSMIQADGSLIYKVCSDSPRNRGQDLES